MAQTDILLETGTNEVEIADFTLGNQRFGVNVAKVREFIPLKSVDITHPPRVHPSIGGVFYLRGHNIPLIQLDEHLGLPKVDTNEWQVIVVTEFNNMTTAFVTDQINMIHRVSWADFKPLNLVMAGSDSPQVTGSISLEGNEILVLDLEHIIGEIFPESVINYDAETFSDKAQATSRADVKIIFAEDSAIIRKQVSKILETIGYGQVTAYTNGQDALDAILELRDKAEAAGEDITNYVSLVLSDIEMPQLDGLTLCRNIKKDLKLKLPVIMFSSLINEQMALKCDSVGADGYSAKPETERIINMIDELTLTKTAEA